MGLRFRKTVRLGPLRLTLGGRRPSLSVRVGKVSHNLTSGRTSVNLPGPFSWVVGRRKGR